LQVRLADPFGISPGASKRLCENARLFLYEWTVHQERAWGAITVLAAAVRHVRSAKSKPKEVEHRVCEQREINASPMIVVTSGIG